MDKLVQGALKDMEVSYRPEDWDLMNARLDEERRTTGKLLFFKTMELLVLLIAVWSIFQFVQYNNLNTSTKQNTITPALQINEDNNIKKNSIETVPNETTRPEINNAKKKKVTPKVIYDKPIAAAQPKLVDPASVYSQDNLTASKETTPVAQTVANRTVIKNLPSQFDQPTQNSQVVTSTSSQVVTTAPVASQVTEVPTSEVPVVLEKMTPLQTIPNKFASVEWNQDLDLKNDDLPTYDFSGDPLPKIKKSLPYHIRAFFSPDMNTKKDDNSMGFSAGALVSKELSDRVQIGTGLSYNYKQFKYIAGELAPTATAPMQLMGITQNQVEIPINLEFTIKESINWRPFFVAGVSGNFVLHTKYDYDLVNYQGQPSELEFDYPNDTKGLLNGGNFKSNSYATANLGIGLERKLDNNLHLFILPTFKYALSGIGPNDDKVNTFSLVMGARATL